MTERTYRCVALGPVQSGVGFATPIFQTVGAETLWYQCLDEADVVRSFGSVNEDLRDQLRDFSGKHTQHVGKPAIFAFVDQAGLAHAGARAKLDAILRKEFGSLQHRPHLRLSIAKFIGDHRLIAEARAGLAREVGKENEADRIVADSLDWEALQFFLALTAAGSIATASSGLRRSASSIAGHLEKLERTLGASLIVATPSGRLEPTAAGKVVAAHAEKMARVVARIPRDLSATKIGFTDVTSPNTRGQRGDRGPRRSEAQERDADMTLAFQFVERAEEANDIGALQQHLVAALENYGTPNFSMMAMLDHEDSIRVPTVLMRNTERTWSDHYLERSHFRYHRAIHSTLQRPFSWNDIESGFLPSDVRKVFEETRDAVSLDGGLVVPAHDVDGLAGAIMLYHNDEEIGTKTRQALRLVSLYAVERARELHELGTVDAKIGAQCPLTGRQREILSFVAIGKSDWDIAAILGIASRTINSHIEKAKASLGVKTRAQAVAISVRRGWIVL